MGISHIARLARESVKGTQYLAMHLSTCYNLPLEGESRTASVGELHVPEDSAYKNLAVA